MLIPYLLLQIQTFISRAPSKMMIALYQIFPIKVRWGVCSIWRVLLDQIFLMQSILYHSIQAIQVYVTALKRIFKYLRGTFDFAICYSGSSVPNLLTAYSDADYTGDLDDRKSRTGCCLIFNNGPTTWFSRKQQCVAVSTTESEYIAASITGREAQWARRLLINLGYEQPPTRLFSDNQAAIRLVLNPEYYKRTKHTDVAYHKIRELQQRGEISVTYVSTHLQLADILTKALPPEKFIKLRSALNVIKHTQV